MHVGDASSACGSDERRSRSHPDLKAGMFLLDELVALLQEPLRARDELGPRASVRVGLEEAERHQDESGFFALCAPEGLVELLAAG